MNNVINNNHNNINNNNINKKKTLRKSNKGKTAINGKINLIINNNKNYRVSNNYSLSSKHKIHNNSENDNNNIQLIKNNRKGKFTSIHKYSKVNESSNINYKNSLSNEKINFPSPTNDLIINLNDDLNINFDEYLETQFDEMDYDEAIRKDNRKFCTTYTDKLKDNQTILNTFCSEEPIKPKSIKLILLILQIDLYFFINGLFYDEEYISKIYHLEKETFFTFAERLFDNFIYAALAGIIISYIIEFFFIEETKIKKILKVEKENNLTLKFSIIKVLKSIKFRYTLFIIISLLISLIALIHIFCFNVVYYHTMKEWLLFSVIIFLLIQLGSCLIYFLQTCLRFISFKFKSERLFKWSL